MSTASMLYRGAPFCHEHTGPIRDHHWELLGPIGAYCEDLALLPWALMAHIYIYIYDMIAGPATPIRRGQGGQHSMMA